MHQISPTTRWVSKNFPGGPTPGPPLLRGPLRSGGGGGEGGERGRDGREGEGKERGCREERPGKWSAPGPALALGRPELPTSYYSMWHYNYRCPLKG